MLLQSCLSTEQCTFVFADKKEPVGICLDNKVHSCLLTTNVSIRVCQERRVYVHVCQDSSMDVYVCCLPREQSVCIYVCQQICVCSCLFAKRVECTC